MSAFDDFDKERKEIDGLLQQGYSIIGIQEDLDGATVKFTSGVPGKSPVMLQLLTADSRKYVTTLIFAGRQLEAM